MYAQSWNAELVDSLTGSFQSLWSGAIPIVLKLIVAIVVFLIGWVVAVAVGKFVAKIVAAFKIDKALRAIGTEEVLSKAGFRLDSGAFIGGLVQWFIIIFVFIGVSGAIGLDSVNLFLSDTVLPYLPKVIAAVLVLIIADFVAGLMQSLAIGSAKAAGSSSAKFVGGITKWAIWIVAILVALDHLSLVGPFAYTLFTGFVAMLAIAGGLAFGLGGKEVATRYLDKLEGDIGNH